MNSKNKLIVLFFAIIIIGTGCSNSKKSSNEYREKTKAPEVNTQEQFAFNDITENDKNRMYTGSLWQNQKRGSMYEDIKARKVGDLVSIIISESAAAQQSSTDTTSKKAKLDGKTGSGVLNFIPSLGAEGTSSYAGNDVTKRSGTLTATVTARIEGVDEYGNLFVKGKRNVLVNRDLQEIEISGYVRPQDIAIDNSIQSAYLADAEVKYNGKLVFDGKTKPGMISNFLGAIVGFFF